MQPKKIRQKINAWLKHNTANNAKAMQKIQTPYEQLFQNNGRIFLYPRT